jgi:hypothetical protein
MDLPTNTMWSSMTIKARNRFYILAGVSKSRSGVIKASLGYFSAGDGLLFFHQGWAYTRTLQSIDLDLASLGDEYESEAPSEDDAKAAFKLYQWELEKRNAHGVGEDVEVSSNEFKQHKVWF